MKISKKIVGYSVAKPTDSNSEAQTGSKIASTASGTTADVIQMHEKLERPNKLIGSTYKLKTPEHVSEHAMYITINDIVLNEGTENELRRPFEVFINSKNLEHYQWIVALTLIMSAVFRKGGDITFLVDELRSVFDPRGGYWNKGKYMPSIIAEIGEVIESHLIDIGMLKGNGPDEEQAKLIEEKKAQLRAKSEAASDQDSASTDEPWMASATLCAKCSTKSVVLMDGCQTCMNCGESKCG
ncbi:MAG: NrdJb [Granulosicoccus sp.]